jgi:two-component system, NtrC family, nitrogen regulation sensor histidine kinase NtrY
VPLSIAGWKNMGFDWRSPVSTRVIILVATIFALALISIGDNRSYLLILALLGAIVFQVKHLVKLVESPNENFATLFDTIELDDNTSSFKTNSEDPGVQLLQKKLNEALVKLRYTRKERDSEYQFYKNIVQHVGIGILTFKRDGSIQIFNSAAKRLLRVSKADSIEDLREMSEPLVESFLKLKTGGRELVRLKSGDEVIQLSVYAIELTLRGEELKLISMSNIQSELEEKEMEAWQNLVRVLTHEIMNSVTPISSLAGIVEEDLKHKLEKGNLNLKKEEAEDIHLSLQTISRRSEGLIRFVKEFRNLTHIPKPKLTEVGVKNLLEEMAILHKKELADHGVSISISVDPEHLTISVDKNMIEQVLINLIKNGIQAFDEQADKRIELTAFASEKGRAAISIKDNGQGIDPEALEKIFIPFFSTKKTGSGIGLSLSKQIMRQHEGRISVKSKLGEGSEFILRF